MGTDWKKVWIRKGLEDTSDPYHLNGWEDTSMSPERVYEGIVKTLKITDSDTVLDVGCGAGVIGQFFSPNNYTGVDRSPTLLSKHTHAGLVPLHCAEAAKLNFPDDSYDVVFCYSVFHYFDSLEYAFRVVKEMDRVSKGRVFIGDLPEASHNDDHLLFTKERFDDWETSKGYYNPMRFNVFRNE